MIEDNHGKYHFFDADPENIDYYINKAFIVRFMFRHMVNRTPETRRALLNASYRDVLVLREVLADIDRMLQQMKREHTLCADRSESFDAMSSHPYSYDD